MSKTAIVTGGARGIGRGCALELAARGYDIALVDLLEPEMKRTAGEIEALGRKALTYQADVASFARAHEVVADVARQRSVVDFLLNDAGASNAKGILEIKEEGIRPHHRGQPEELLQLHPRHRADHAEARDGRTHRQHVVAERAERRRDQRRQQARLRRRKAGILGLTRSLAKELGPKIAINAICPGVIETELGNSLTKARGPELTKGIVLNRLGKPADVAQLVASSRPANRVSSPASTS